MRHSFKPFTPLIPYIAVAIGLYGLSSAWVAIVSYHIGMLVTVIVGKNAKHELMKRRTSVWWYLSAIILSLGGVILFLLWPYAFFDADGTTARLHSVGIDRRTWPFFVAYFCSVHPILEELFWRGCLMQDKPLVTVHNCAFGGYHAFVIAAFAAPVWCVPVFAACVFAGWLWRMMREATGSSLLPILTHFAADASIVGAVHFRLFAS